MNKKAKKLVLIDGNAIVHRAYHALPPLTNKKGELLNAAYGFTTILLKVLSDIQPDYILATFDLAGKTFRHHEYEQYKATRVKAPDELYVQFDRVKEIVRAFNIPIFEKEGFEADDMIGTLSFQAEEIKDLETIIVTGDLDTLQLVTPKTKVYALRRGMSDITIYDEKAVMERYGFTPDKMIDFKGLCGDQSDNIPGVKGIGEKGAINLIKEFGTVEDIYKSIDKIKGATHDKLERDKMNALMSKKLATIVRDVPVKLEIEKSAAHDFDRKKVTDLFQELSFFSLIKRIPAQEGLKGSTFDIPEDASRLNLGESGGVKDFKFETVSEKTLRKFLEDKNEVAIYIRAIDEDIRGIAIAYKTGRAGYIEWNDATKKELQNFLENKKSKKIGYDLKNDLEILATNKILLAGLDFDVMLGAYVANPGVNIELRTLVLEEFGEELEENKKGQLGLGLESPESVMLAACRKADYIWKLKNIYAEKIKEITNEQSKSKELSSFKDKRSLAPSLRNVFDNLEMPLVEILAGMEKAGIKLNTIIFEGISKKIEKRISNLERNIYDLAGTEFNINSPRQLADVLFINLKLPTVDIKKLKTGYSTAAGELAKLRGEHKIIEKIEEYREIFKLKTTYLDTLPTLVDEDSRIHTKFNQAVTATGRLSSSEPNLQNIPIRTDVGQLLRTAFEAEDGYSLVGADYSQIDLRAVAHVSRDKNMIEAFQKGEDIHRATAALINKVTPSQVTEKMRGYAKALNFGIIYGMSVFGLSSRTGLDRDEAKKFIDAYFEKFSGVAEYMKNTRDFVKQNKYVETEFGRRRYIPEINSPNFQVQNAAERMAINMPIQGLSADIVKLAMIDAQKLIDKDYKDSAKMVLQVHDELIFEVKEDVCEQFALDVKDVMENVYKLRVPLVVDVKIGDNWGEI